MSGWFERTNDLVIQIGIIGFGKMGKIRFEAVSQHQKGKIVAIVDPLLAHPMAGVKLYSSTNELFKDPSIDAVFVCVPNYLNKPLTIQALQSGKHVFCEKPPAFNANDISEIIAAERSS